MVNCWPVLLPDHKNTRLCIDPQINKIQIIVRVPGWPNQSETFPVRVILSGASHWRVFPVFPVAFVGDGQFYEQRHQPRERIWVPAGEHIEIVHAAGSRQEDFPVLVHSGDDGEEGDQTEREIIFPGAEDNPTVGPEVGSQGSEQGVPQCAGVLADEWRGGSPDPWGISLFLHRKQVEDSIDGYQVRGMPEGAK